MHTRSCGARQCPHTPAAALRTAPGHRRRRPRVCWHRAAPAHTWQPHSPPRCAYRSDGAHSQGPTMRDRMWALASLAPMQSQCKPWYETTQGCDNAGIGRNGAVGTRTNTSSRGFQGARAFGKPVRSCMSSVVEPCAARPSPRFAGLAQRLCVSSCRHLDGVRLPLPSTLGYPFV